MKKHLQLLLAIFAISQIGGGIINAQFNDTYITDLLDGSTPKIEGAYNRLLTEYNNERGYEKGQLTCNATNSNIKIDFPAIYDGDYTKATYYDIFLSPYRLEELKTNNNIDSSKIFNKRVSGGDNQEKISIELSPSDGLDANQVYYGFVVPINAYDVVGTPTEEICFNTSNAVCALGTECNSMASIASMTDTQGTTHGSASTEDHGAANCTSMKYANVKAKQTDDNVIVLTWTSVSNGNVDIAVVNPDTEQYESIGEVPMSDEKFEYKMSWNGEYNFSFNNGCDLTPYRFKFDGKMSTGKKVSEKIVTPATGPAENVLYIAIAAIVLYGVYAIFGRKSEN